MFSPGDGVAAPRVELSSGYCALHGHDRWSQLRHEAITENRERGLRRLFGVEMNEGEGESRLRGKVEKD